MAIYLLLGRLTAPEDRWSHSLLMHSLLLSFFFYYCPSSLLFSSVISSACSTALIPAPTAGCNAQLSRSLLRHAPADFCRTKFRCGGIACQVFRLVPGVTQIVVPSCRRPRTRGTSITH